MVDDEDDWAKAVEEGDAPEASATDLSLPADLWLFQKQREGEVDHDDNYEAENHVACLVKIGLELSLAWGAVFRVHFDREVDTKGQNKFRD